MRTVDTMTTTEQGSVPTSQGDAPDYEMARRLRAARALTGLGQTEFAKLTGISRSIVSQYETGRNAADYKHPFLVTWAYYSGETLEWITTGHRPGSGGPPLASPDNDRYLSTLAPAA